MADIYDEVFGALTSQKDRARTIKIVELRKDIDAENIRYEAYCDGVEDAIKAITLRTKQEG